MRWHLPNPGRAWKTQAIGDLMTMDAHSTHAAQEDARNQDIRIWVNGDIVHRDDAKNPGAGGAEPGNFKTHHVEHLGIHGVAAPLFGLQNLEETGLVEIVNCRLGYLAVGLALGATLHQRRPHGAGGGNQFLGAGRIQSIFVHVFTCLSLVCLH